MRMHATLSGPAVVGGGNTARDDTASGQQPLSRHRARRFLAENRGLMAENSPTAVQQAPDWCIRPGPAAPCRPGFSPTRALPSAVHVGLKPDLQIDLQTYPHSDLPSIAQGCECFMQGCESFITRVLMIYTALTIEYRPV